MTPPKKTLLSSLQRATTLRTTTIVPPSQTTFSLSIISPSLNHHPHASPLNSNFTSHHQRRHFSSFFSCQLQSQERSDRDTNQNAKHTSDEQARFAREESAFASRRASSSSSQQDKKREKFSFRTLLKKRLNDEDIYSYDTPINSDTIAVASLPSDISQYKSQDELLAFRDVLDLHIKHATKERALNIYYKYYRSSMELEPSFKTYRYLFYKWRASPNTLRILEADFDALCERKPDDLRGIRSVLNVLLLCQRAFQYPVSLNDFFLKSQGTDKETTLVWDNYTLGEWMPEDHALEPVLRAQETMSEIHRNDGLVQKNTVNASGVDLRKYIHYTETPEHRKRSK